MALSLDWVIVMKEIKTKITAPFLITIIIVPLVTLVLFNIGMRIYFARTAVQELKNTVAAVEVLVKNQVGENLLENNDNGILTTLGSLRAVLRASKLAANTEFILFNKNLDVVFPKNLNSKDTFITDSLLTQINTMLPTAEKNKAYTITVGRDSYIVFANRLVQASLARSPYIVFISSVNSGNGVMNTLNIMLILIMLVAVIISVFIALKVSKSISKPIINLCGYAKKIGRGEFVYVQPDSSSREIYDLCSNMNEMSEQLQNSNNAQKTFLQNASHELRTPLMSIQGYAEGIIKGVFQDTDKAARIICDESKRLNTLVEELLTLSHIENKTYASEMTNLNISHMIKEYIQRVNGLAMKENKEIICDIQGDNILVAADDNLLSRAVINVISNCIRYAKTKVKVSVYEKESNAFIKIGDDGVGINDADIPHIFERFYKGEKGNFGLGLSIAKIAVEYMGGTITAYNTENGAEFLISLHRKI